MSGQRRGMGFDERASEAMPARRAEELAKELTSMELFAKLQRAARGAPAGGVPPPDASLGGADGMRTVWLAPPVTGARGLAR